jgi:resolvase-like protein
VTSEQNFFVRLRSSIALRSSFIPLAAPRVPLQFVSLSEQVDTSTPTGKTVFTVLGAVAELDRSLIVERVRAGEQACVMHGLRRKFLFHPCELTRIRKSS